MRDFKRPKKKTDDWKNVKLVAFTKKDYKPLLSDFILKNKVTLTRLRYNFVMHLLTLQIYGLINGNDILQLLLELDSQNTQIMNPIIV